MLTAPQTVVRPSSRSGSKQENEEIEKNVRIASGEKRAEKGDRENLNNMGDDINVTGEGHVNHMEKSESDEDDDDQEEVSNLKFFLRISCSVIGRRKKLRFSFYYIHFRRYSKEFLGRPFTRTTNDSFFEVLLTQDW